eukprot:763082-Hanusia_phi.AAC.4
MAAAQRLLQLIVVLEASSGVAAWAWEECAWVCPSVVTADNLYTFPNPGTWTSMIALCCQAPYPGNVMIDLEGLNPSSRQDVAFFIMSYNDKPFQVSGTYTGTLDIVGWMGDDSRCCLPRQTQWRGRVYGDSPVRVDEADDWWPGAASRPASAYFSCVLGDGRWCKANLTWTNPVYDICGDGFRDVLEECDDGNTVSSDGCSSDCTIETGYICNRTTQNWQLVGSLSQPYKYFGTGDVCVTVCDRAGTFLNVSQDHNTSKCDACPRGKYSITQTYYIDRIGSQLLVGGVRECTPCPAGTFAENTSSTSCQLCPSGTASSGIGMTTSATCRECEPGTFSFRQGLASCLNCSEVNLFPPQYAHYTTGCQWDCNTGFQRAPVAKNDIRNNNLTVDQVFGFDLRWQDHVLHCHDFGWAQHMGDTYCDPHGWGWLMDGFDWNQAMVCDICCFFSWSNLTYQKSLCGVPVYHTEVCVKECAEGFQRFRSTCLLSELVPSEKVSSCFLNYTWNDLVFTEFPRREADFKTGGLGSLMIRDQVESWLCEKGHQCVNDPADFFCFTYDEQTAAFYPWGSMSDLKRLH